MLGWVEEEKERMRSCEGNKKARQERKEKKLRSRNVFRRFKKLSLVSFFLSLSLSPPSPKKWGSSNRLFQLRRPCIASAASGACRRRGGSPRRRGAIEERRRIDRERWLNCSIAFSVAFVFFFYSSSSLSLSRAPTQGEQENALAAF